MARPFTGCRQDQNAARLLQFPLQFGTPSWSLLASTKRAAGPGWRNGRRWGLKIPCPEEDVWVRLPPRALQVVSLWTDLWVCLVRKAGLGINDALRHHTSSGTASAEKSSAARSNRGR